MCAAAARSAAAASCRVIVAAVCDEEYESLGMRALVASGIRADAAILTEPTRLTIAPAHRGFVWMLLRFRGRAAHGSRYDLGVDAVTPRRALPRRAACTRRRLLTRTTHALLGRASLHASTIAGGEGFSTYPGECVLRIERRTIPGESAEQSSPRSAPALEKARARRMSVGMRRIELVTAQSPSDVRTDQPIVRALAAALEAEALPANRGDERVDGCRHPQRRRHSGVCFGPGDIGLAHAAEEYVE
jgi:acetylornithine deacetylase